MTNYVVQARQWEGGWELHVEGVGVTQSASLATASRETRDYLATVFDGNPDDYSVIVIIDLGGLETEPEQARLATAEAAKAQKDAAAAARRVARNLRAHGLSVSDVAAVMHVSRGRVSQLTR